MTATGWLVALALGSALGALGQGLRVIVGIRKLQAEFGKSWTDHFEATRLTMSVFIGAVVGSMAVIAMFDSENFNSLDSKSVLSIVAAGYAGTDFLEGLMAKYLPK